MGWRPPHHRRPLDLRIGQRGRSTFRAPHDQRQRLSSSRQVSLRSAISGQRSALSGQRSAFSDQLSAISCQLSGPQPVA
ncbi:MAG: hypothetical protein DMF89_12820 [Acidobacteria bacterium]|nr:MAG: hypothetical protein DMF90_11365 [Acidobacteriota bacterium]PYR49335.1 MAG: hypothetical protein DMF89_12820 [Acidobacteriota bacterium]